MWYTSHVPIYFLTIHQMIKGIEYTKAMDQKIVRYKKENLLTIKELTAKADLTESTLYKFRNRGKISIQSLKKIKDNLWLDLLPKK